MALRPVAAARVRMSTISARCWSALSVLRVGQSMLATVAIHMPRISRAIAGGLVSVGGTGSESLMAVLELEHAIAATANASRMAVRACELMSSILSTDG